MDNALESLKREVSILSDKLNKAELKLADSEAQRANIRKMLERGPRGY